MIKNYFSYVSFFRFMFTHSKTPSNYPSAAFIVTLVVSLMLHGVLVFWEPEVSNVVQSGSTTRVSVAVRQFESEPKKTAQVNNKAHIEKATEKPIPKPIVKHENKVATPQDVQAQVTERKPVEQKSSQKKILSTVQPDSPKTTHQIASKPLKHKVDVNTPKIIPPKAESELEQQKETSKPHILTKKSEEKTISQAVRYELGSNNNPKPEYPAMARKRGWEGEVVLGVYVRPDGSIKHLTFVKSTNYGVLNHEAYETVRTSWQFKVIEEKDDLNESMYIEIPFTFDLANR